MISLLYNILKLLRPRQWIKNLAIFATITFSGQLFNGDALQRVVLGFFIFCMLSSAIYIINDICDIKKDQLHPFKRLRPLASGKIPVTVAFVVSILLTVTALFLGLFITLPFFIFLIIYLLLQLFYSLLFKQIAVIDILAIASGYILRVYAGEFASGYHISVWLLLTTISISLFLAVGKRRSELTLVSKYSATQLAAMRQSLSHYSARLLDSYATIFATSTFIFYSLFTFLESPQGIGISNDFLLPDFLPAYLKRKWLMITILPVVYGLMRYLQDIYEKQEGESPEKVLLSDKSLLVTVIGWIILVVVIIYFLNPATF